MATAFSSAKSRPVMPLHADSDGDEPDNLFGATEDTLFSRLFSDNRVHQPDTASVMQTFTAKPKTEKPPVNRRLDMDASVPANANPWSAHQLEGDVTVVATTTTTTTTTSAAVTPSPRAIEAIDTTSEEAMASPVKDAKSKASATPIAKKALPQPLSLTKKGKPVPLQLQLEPVAGGTNIPTSTTATGTSSTTTTTVMAEPTAAIYTENTMDLDNPFFKKAMPLAERSAIVQMGDQLWDTESMATLMAQALQNNTKDTVLEHLFVPVVDVMLQYLLPGDKEAFIERFGTDAVKDHFTLRQENMFLFAIQHRFSLDNPDAARPFLTQQAIQLMDTLGGKASTYRAHALYNMLYSIVHFSNVSASGQLRLHITVRSLLSIVHDQEGVAAAIVADAPLPNRCALAPWVSIDAHTAHELTWSYTGASGVAEEFSLLVHEETARLVSAFYDAVTLHLVAERRVRELRDRFPRFITLNEFKSDPAAKVMLVTIASDIWLSFSMAWQRIGPESGKHLSLFVAPDWFVSACYLAQEQRAVRDKQEQKQKQKKQQQKSPASAGSNKKAAR